MRRMFFQILDSIDFDWCDPYWIICSAVVPLTMCANSRQGWGVITKLCRFSPPQNRDSEYLYCNQGGPMQNQSSLEEVMLDF